MRIGIPIIGSKDWHGGLVYVQNCIRALQANFPRKHSFFLVVTRSTLKLLPDQQDLLREGLFNGIILSGFTADIQGAHIPVITTTGWEDCKNHIDRFFPWLGNPVPGLPSISWIPDFQFDHLPQFFSPEDLDSRNKLASTIARTATELVLSSEDALQDFKRLFPESKARTSVLQFHSSMDVLHSLGDVQSILEKYKVLEPYYLCSNQFWAHKNHRTLFEAIRILDAQGGAPLLLCTGSPSDHRNLGYYQELVQGKEAWDKRSRIRLLGMIPRADQLQLIRGAIAMVQPSLFEGWSTVIEDCRSLGCPVIYSDIAVHKEQNPPHGIVFPAQDALALAQCLSMDLSIFPSPGSAREEAGHTHVQQKVKSFARNLNLILDGQPSSSAKHVQALLATSIAPHNIDIQKRCVDTWVQMGCEVVSLNTASEIRILGDVFPNIRFVSVNRDGSTYCGKPLIRFDDIMQELSRSHHTVVGIVNSDIFLKAHPHDIEELFRKASAAMVYCQRVDVDSLDELKGTRELWGIDAFFFPPRMAVAYPETPLCIGAPWWDYWILAVQALRGESLVRWEGALAYHQKHPVAWDQSLHQQMGSLVRFELEKMSGNPVPRPPIPPMSWDEDVRYSIQVLTLFHRKMRSHFPDVQSDMPVVVEKLSAISPPKLWWTADKPVETGDDLLLEIPKRIPQLAAQVKILHQVGAHLFEEEDMLRRLFPSLQQFVLFEPLPDIYTKLKAKVAGKSDIVCLPYAICDSNGTSIFHQASFAMSSSLLPMKMHKEIWPNIREVADIEVQTRTLATVLEQHHLECPDFLFLDVQGAEYLVLSSIPRTLLQQIAMIYTEASTDEIYAGGKTLEELKKLLEDSHTFMGYAPQLNRVKNHGNAFFLRRDLVPAPSSAVGLATALKLPVVEQQQQAVANWIQAGFHVVSYSAAHEIMALRDHFPGVHFRSGAVEEPIPLSYVVRDIAGQEVRHWWVIANSNTVFSQSFLEMAKSGFSNYSQGVILLQDSVGRAGGAFAIRSDNLYALEAMEYPIGGLWWDQISALNVLDQAQLEQIVIGRHVGAILVASNELGEAGWMGAGAAAMEAIRPLLHPQKSLGKDGGVQEAIARLRSIPLRDEPARVEPMIKAALESLSNSIDQFLAGQNRIRQINVEHLA